MRILQKLKDARKSSRQVVTQVELGNHFCISALADNYGNMFAQVRPLINEMKLVRPYGVGRNGAKLPVSRTPELALLNSPNAQMGWADFADLMFTTWLTEDELDIRVFQERGKVYGYVILPAGSKKQSGSDVYFEYRETDGSTSRVGLDEVMTLRFSRSPRNPGHGVSPASSVQIYAQIDDLVAQYQRAFFENGARPETIMIIRASTREKFETKKAELEGGFKGADKRNKTLFLWRQFLPDGNEADEVEVKTIQGNNSTLALREISDIISDRLNKSVGVSNFLLGDDASAKYDNAELSDHIFTKRRVFPALVMFWSEFQHELDRVKRDGLDYGIEFELELPELTDRLKTKADTAAVNANTLISLITAGAKPSAAVNALGLGKDWQSVADSLYYEKNTSAKVGSLAEAVDKLKRLTPKIPANIPDFDAKIPKNDRNKVKSALKTQDVNFVGSDYEPVWDLPADQDIKNIYDILIKCAESLSAEDGAFDLKQAKIDINKMLAKAAEDGALTGAKVLQSLAVGPDASEELKNIIAHGYEPSKEALKAIEERTDKLLSDFSEDAKEIFQTLKDEAKEEGLTAYQIQKALQDAMPRYRAESIARNETHAAFNNGRLDLDKQLADTYGLEIELEWSAHLDDHTCEVCKEMNGRTVKLGDAFPDHIFVERDGEKVQINFEHSVWNMEGHSPNAHPGCRCTFNEKVIGRK